MLVLALLPAAIVVGVIAGQRLQPVFPLVMRGQLVLVGAPLMVTAGWLFDWAAVGPWVLGWVGLEIAVFTLLAPLAREREHRPLIPVAFSNSGFWATPVATVLLGPAAGAAVAAIDAVGQSRAAILISWLRRDAPSRQPGWTRFVDYIQPAGFAIGVALQLSGATPPEAVPVAFEVLAIVNGLVGMALLGVSLPRPLPGPEVFRARARWALGRFLPAGVLGLATLAGLAPPAMLWVVALAMAPTNLHTFARLYGYDLDGPTAVLVTTWLLAVPATIAWALLR